MKNTKNLIPTVTIILLLITFAALAIAVFGTGTLQPGPLLVIAFAWIPLLVAIVAKKRSG